MKIQAVEFQLASERAVEVEPTLSSVARWRPAVALHPRQIVAGVRVASVGSGSGWMVASLYFLGQESWSGTMFSWVMNRNWCRS